MNPTPDTRASLLLRLRDPQDERAWEEFAAIYTPLIYGLARKRGFQDADASDLVQEVCRSVAAAVDRYDPDPQRGSFRGWLFRIARNLMINFLASQRRNPQGTGGSGTRWQLESHAAPSAEDSALFDEEYRRRIFEWAVEQVRGEFQGPTWQAFWRTAVLNEKPKAVAEGLGMTVGAVYVYKNRVLTRIKRKIEEADPENPTPG